MPIFKLMRSVPEEAPTHQFSYINRLSEPLVIDRPLCPQTPLNSTSFLTPQNPPTPPTPPPSYPLSPGTYPSSLTQKQKNQAN